MTYTAFNAVLTVILLALAILISPNRRDWAVSSRVALMLTLIAIPWDFFAVRQGIWMYSDAGLRFAGMPLNDAWFIFICSLFAAIVIGKEERLDTNLPKSGLLERRTASAKARGRGEQGSSG